MRHLPKGFLSTLLAAAFTVAMATMGAVAHAQTLYWDTGTSSGLTPGNGTWSTSTSDLFWATGTSPGITTPTFWTDGRIANFQAAGSSGITISGTVTASAVQFAGGNVSTSISGGTLIVSSASGMSSAGTNGGASAVISSNVVLGTGTAQTYTFSTTSSQPFISISGNISENGVAGINKTGANSLYLSGSNTYTGVTTISAGMVGFAKRVSLYGADTSKWTASNFNFVATAAFNVGGTGEFTDSDIGTLAALGTATGGFRSGSQLRLDTTNAASGTFTLSSAIANPNGGANVLNLAKVGNGTLELTGANTYTGQTIVQTGTLKFSTIGDWASSGALATNLGAPTSAANGQINLANGVANQTIALLYVGAGSTTNRSLYYNYGNGGGAASVTIDSAGTGPLVFTSGVTGNANNYAKPLYLQGSYTGAANEIQGVIAGSAVSALYKNGAGTWKLSGTNTYNAVNTINAGVLEVTTLTNGGVNSGIGAASNAAGNLVFGAASATLRYSGTANVTTDRGFTFSSGAGGGATIESSGAGTLSFDNTVAIAYGTTNQTRVLTLGGTNTGDNTFAKVLANNGTGTTSFVKTGAGSWILNAANTYSGSTSITGGRLQVGPDGSINSTSRVTVNGAEAEFKYNSATAFSQPLTLTQGTLSGTGTINTGVLIGSNVVLAPGNSPGTQTYSSGTWASGGTYQWEINDWNGGAGSNYDQAIFTSGLAITSSSVSTFTIAVTSLTGSNTSGSVDNFGAAKTFTIASAGGSGITGFDRGKFTISTGSFANTIPTGAGFWVSQSGSNVLLNYAPSAVAAVTTTPSLTTMIVGGTATLSAAIVNAGPTGADSMNYANLAITNIGSLSGSSAVGILVGGTSTQTGLFTTNTPNVYTFTPTLSATNANILTAANLGTISSGSITVLNHALPGFASGVVDPFTSTSLTLDFGDVSLSAGVQNLSWSLTNLADPSYGTSLTAGLALLGITTGTGSLDFTSGASEFASLVAGGTNSYTATFTPTSPGLVTQSYTLQFGDQQTIAGASSNLRSLTINLQAVVSVPEPGSLALASIGVTAAAAWARRRRQRGSAKTSPV